VLCGVDEEEDSSQSSRNERISSSKLERAL
jgi:hypothetical protein